MDFFKEASELAACGFQVFPLGAAGADLRNRATDDLSSLSIWDRLHHGADVGVALGERSDALVVHVAASGFDALHALAARGCRVPECPISQDSSGAIHLWFRNLAGFTGWTWDTPTGLRIFGEGCTVSAPPSRDRFGGRWEWFVAPSAVRPPVLPEWLVARIITPPSVRKSATAGDVA